MLNPRNSFLFVVILGFALVTSACATEKSASQALPENGLKACPSSPNCVSSDAQDEKHQIAALSFALPAAEAWTLLQEQVAKLPRTVVVTVNDGYLHAECRSALFGFVDDLEFQLRADQGLIAVRSAARTGYYDFGANRQRVEALRSSLQHASGSP